MKKNFDSVRAGLSADAPEYQLADDQFTDSRNFRYRESAAERVRGYTQVMGSLSATAIWASPITDGVSQYWVYADLTVFYATDGSTHANITSTTFAANADLAYTGGPYNGFMVVTDGTGAPQTWLPGLGNDFTALVNWPAATVAKVIRPFGRYLVALRLTETGTFNPRLLRWSASAVPGALPASWDFADPSNDSGRTELGQTDDPIIDCLPLRGSNIIYRQFNTWIMEFVGGRDVFGFRPIFSQMGMLTEDCARAFKNRHFVVSDHDVVVHDGNEPVSIIDKRLRRWLFNRINIGRFKRSFVAADYQNREMIFCFPEAGNDYPNLALAWNWVENSVDIRELGRQLTFAAHGVIPGASGIIDLDTGIIDLDLSIIDEELYNPMQLRLVFTDGTAQLAHQWDTGQTFNGTAMTASLTRASMPLDKSFNYSKDVKRIIPRIVGTTGETVNIYVGTKTLPEGTVTWSGPFPFVIGVDRDVNPFVSGYIHDVRYEYTGNFPLQFLGYEVEWERDGER